MSTPIFFLAIVLLLAFSYWTGRRRAVAAAGGHPVHLHSLPGYHGAYLALWCGIPGILLAAGWFMVEEQVAEYFLLQALPAATKDVPADRMSLLLNDVKNIAAGYNIFREVTPEMERAAAAYTEVHNFGRAIALTAALGVSVIGLGIGRRYIHTGLRARNRVERVINVVMIVASTIAILTTIGIVLSLLFEAIRFFSRIPFWEFLFGLDWNPQTAIREDQVAAQGAFGAVPLFTGTLLITVIAMTVAVPIGLFSAIYLSDYAPKKIRGTVKPLLEILAGVPTVVYGFFAALTVAPFVRDTFSALGFSVSSESALAAGVVMGIMIIPFVSSLSDDVMNAVPQTLRDGAYAMGATQSETIKQVVFPAALPGIVGAILLAISRAIGETMIVVMAAGLSANLTANPFEAVTTVTVQIVTLLTGDQEFDSAKTLAAFALGITLFAVTLCLNVVALNIVRKYREKYE
jgi:phosphate transport system permease protein